MPLTGRRHDLAGMFKGSGDECVLIHQECFFLLAQWSCCVVSSGGGGSVSRLLLVEMDVVL